MSAANPETRPLPCKWDGVPVEWNAWDYAPMFICPPPKPQPCPGCGLIVPEATARGVRREDTLVMVGGTRTPRTRLMPSLYAYRCTACGHTQVDDGKALWDLDESDYTPFGSVAT